MNNGTLTEKISNQIKKRIILGEYAVGTQLPNEQVLAESLNVSRTTIREAVKLLVSKNVLEIERGRGTFVAAVPGLSEDPFGLEFVSADTLKHDLCQFRSMIEPEVYALAALNASQEEIESMGLCVAKMKEICPRAACGSADECIDVFIDEELKFHVLVFKMTHNLIFERMSDIIARSVVINCTELLYRQTFDFIRYSESHSHIYEAIKAHDSDAAKKYASEHAETFAIFMA